jgi:hypothetical protein
MTSSPRGSNAATAIAVILALALAFAWLRTSDGGTLAVPAGLSVGTVPTPEPAEPARVGQAEGVSGAEGVGAGARLGGPSDRERTAGRRRRGVVRGSAGGEDAARQDPPATAPAPTVESRGDTSGTAGSGGAAGGTSGSTRAAPRQAPPEFALE